MTVGSLAAVGPAAVGMAVEAVAAVVTEVAVQAEQEEGGAWVIMVAPVGIAQERKGAMLEVEGGWMEWAAAAVAGRAGGAVAVAGKAAGAAAARALAWQVEQAARPMAGVAAA